jgi:hypothetical protein
MRVRERFGRPFPVAVGQWCARSCLVSGLWRTGARDRPSGAVIHGAGLLGRYFRSSQACNRIWAAVSGPAVSRCVPLSPAVARTHDGRDSRRLRGISWASGGPLAGAEGLLDLLAGDLVAAGYAVGVDGEQDTHAVPATG